MKKPQKRRPRRSAAHWELLVDAWQKGTESAADFCARHDISESTLYRWEARLNRNGKPAVDQPVPSANFVPVRVVAPAEPAEPPKQPELPEPLISDEEGYVEIVAGNGRVLRVRGAVTERTLSRVLAVVEQC